MNTSLSPNDTLGRMLHTFTSTAYEIDGNDFDSLKRNNFLHNIQDKIETMRFIHLDVKDFQEETVYEIPGAVIAKVFEATPGSTYGFTLMNGVCINIEIGYTGTYELPIDKNNPVKSVRFNPMYSGKIELGFIGQDKYPITDVVAIGRDEEKILSLKEVSYIERCEQYCHNGSNVLDIYECIENQNAAQIENNEYSVTQLDNIVFLRIGATDINDTNKYCILEDKPIDLNGIEVYQGQLGDEISSAHTYGLIELQVSTAYPYFKPPALKISSGVTVDIYYSGLTYTYEDGGVQA